jgi:hypothetical protein
MITNVKVDIIIAIVLISIFSSLGLYFYFKNKSPVPSPLILHSHPCSQSQCKPELKPECDCKNKQCGSDGCGGSCGTCKSGMECSQFKCVPDYGIHSKSGQPNLTNGYYLTTNDTLVSANRQYECAMQPDGNICILKNSTPFKCLFGPDMVNKVFYNYLVISSDGYLSFIDKFSTYTSKTWSSPAGKDSSLFISDIGNLSFSNSDGTVLWCMFAGNRIDSSTSLRDGFFLTIGDVLYAGESLAGHLSIQNDGNVCLFQNNGGDGHTSCFMDKSNLKPVTYIVNNSQFGFALLDVNGNLVQELTPYKAGNIVLIDEHSNLKYQDAQGNSSFSWP